VPAMFVSKTRSDMPGSGKRWIGIPEVGSVAQVRSLMLGSQSRLINEESQATPRDLFYVLQSGYMCGNRCPGTVGIVCCQSRHDFGCLVTQIFLIDNS